MENSSNQIFDQLEHELNLEKENEKLKEENKLLQSRINALELLENERNKIDPTKMQAVVIYLHANGPWLMCEEWQEGQFKNYGVCDPNAAWGRGLHFDSIAGMYTQLFRLGFKYVATQKHYYRPEGTTLNTEVWVKDCCFA